jgi:hypothetical protein
MRRAAYLPIQNQNNEIKMKEIENFSYPWERVAR